MTIRQLLIGGSMAAASKISHKGSATASADSISIPTHAANDTIIIFAKNGGAVTTTITVPSGWTTINERSQGFNGVVAYKKAASSGETSGTWTNAEYMICEVYDGVASIGGAAEAGSTLSSSTVTWPAITMSESGGTSWVVGCVAYRQYSTTNWDGSPTGMSKRSSISVDASSGRCALHDTASGVESWDARTTTIGSSSWVSFTFELVSE